jgi:galactonate dehydratase
MKIDHLEIFEVAASHRGDWIFVRLCTDAGLSGLGEASQSGDDAGAVALLKRLGTLLEGEDPTTVEALRQKAAGDPGIADGGVPGATALGAVDQALWDIAAQAQGQPLWRFLGGNGDRARIPLYANLNRGTRDRSSSGFAEAAKRAVVAGFKAVKSTPFDEVHSTGQHSTEIVAAAEPGLDRLRATRDAIGADIELLVDCHQRFDLESATEIARRVKPLDLYWLEEPVPDSDVEALRQLVRESGQRIAGGEGIHEPDRFREYIDGPAVHVLMPDVKQAGGLTPCRRVAAQANEAGIPISPHNPSGPVSTMASAHLAAASDNVLCLEYAFGEVEWRHQLVRPQERVTDGHIELSEAAGLGLEFDEAVLAAHRV